LDAWEEAMNEGLRDKLNLVLGAAGVVFALVSLWAGMNGSSKWMFDSHEKLGSYLLAFATLVPPVYFWIDWVWLCSFMPVKDDRREVAKHTHDLSRNIWIGLLGVLAVLFKLAPVGVQ
jgi:hypothetical protein